MSRTVRAAPALTLGLSLVATGVAAGVTAGCSRQDDGPAPTISSSSAPPPSASASPAPSGRPSASGTAGTAVRPPVYGAKVRDAVGVSTGRLPSGGQRKVVAQALVAYSMVRLTAFNQAEVDLDAVAAVASGDALQQVRSYVAGLQQRHQHTVGRLAIDVSSVMVTGKTARISSCLRNGTADANRADQVIQRDIPAAYRVRATATEVAPGRWLISAIRFAAAPSCP